MLPALQNRKTQGLRRYFALNQWYSNPFSSAFEGGIVATQVRIG